MIGMLSKNADGPFGMTAAEYKEAITMTQRSCEESFEGLKEMISSQFFLPLAEQHNYLNFSKSTVNGSSIRVVMEVHGFDGQLFDDLEAFCTDLEEKIAYPEVRFKISKYPSLHQTA